MTPQDMARLLRIRVERENRAQIALQAALRLKQEADEKFQGAYSSFMDRRQFLLDYIGTKRDSMMTSGASVSAFENYKQYVGRLEDEVVGLLRTARELKTEADKAEEFAKEERERYMKAYRDKTRMENLETMLKEQFALAADFAEEQEIEELAGDRRKTPQ